MLKVGVYLNLISDVKNVFFALIDGSCVYLVGSYWFSFSFAKCVF